jgi:hypothetical protein
MTKSLVIVAICWLGCAAAQVPDRSAPLERLIEPKQIDRLLGGEPATPLLREEIRSAMHYCSCSDTPEPHYPYAMLVVTTPRGDVILRSEGNDGAIRIRALAVRHGNQYCPMDPDQPCHGEFADPCGFTDSVYGPLLAKYFPRCKIAPVRGE